MTLADYLQKHYRPNTAKAYIREIEIYIANNPNNKKYTYAEIVNYIGILRTNYSNARTINRILSGIKAYYNYLCFTKIRKDNPGKSIKLRDKISRDIQLQDLFTQEELEGLLHVKKERYRALEHRNKVLMSLLIYQGLQPRELANISLEDINLEQATVYIKSTSTSNSRTLPLKATQILLFHYYQTAVRKKLLKEKQTEKYLVGIRGNEYTETEITSHFKHNYKGIFEPRKVNAKTIRQSVIANLLKQHHDLRIVQTFAGHKYPSTTERYKQNDVEALQQQINLHHPIK
ncbi:MAG TPA: tyrosine-type recombinase/integrase [Bacteroidia bacterium]|nr:tyrosine-type recombinase/integrase [Bacteroidia bacterium]